MAAKKIMIRIRLKAYDHKILDDSAKLIVDVLSRDNASFAGPIPLPTDKEIVTIPVSSSSREHTRGSSMFTHRLPRSWKI